MVDAIVGALLDKLLAFLASEGQQLLELDSQFDKLKDELGYMQDFVKEVDRMRRKEGRDILMRLTKDMRELVYDVEDVISDCHIQFLKQEDGCLSNIVNCSQLLKFRFKISKQLKVINQKIEVVKERMKSYLSAPSTITSIKEESKSVRLKHPILLEEADIVGLEDDTSKVEKWILQSQGPSTVIGIIGMGGIGKTTLARKILKKDTIKNSFEHKIFVTVSQNCELEDLLKKMLIKMNVDEKSFGKKEVEDLLEKVKEEFGDKKYLVVLDDVWENEMSWWDSLKFALPRTFGCYVIVTTRNEQVAKTMGAIEKHIHRPQTLSAGDSWSLFSMIAFAWNGGECPNSDLEGLGKEIVAGCKGLPLAIRIIGGTLFGRGDSINEWRRILEHLKEELVLKKTDEPVMSRLELSYEELPTYLKPCFLCFSMLPEDYAIEVDDIVHWWISEGFVSELNERTTFEIEREYVVELYNRCLLVGEHDMFAKNIETIKIHDLVRDMALKIAREVNFTSLNERDKPELSAQSRRVAIFDNGVIKHVGSTRAKKSKMESKLRIMWGLSIKKEVLLNKNLELDKLKQLRVLNASFRLNEEEEVIAKDWLYGIRSLLNLVYLKLDNCAVEKLPDSIGNLSNLQILTLRCCYNLKMLPSTITKLDKLIAFTIIFCESLTSMPEGIGRLSKLEQLVWLPYKDSIQKITSQFGQLKNLGQLRRLEVELENQNHLEEVILNVLPELKHLQFLHISFMPYDDDEGNAFVGNLNQRLSSPLQCLEELWLLYYPGETTPVWLNPTSLPSLKFLYIAFGDLRYISPEFWEENWKIEGLCLENLYELEEEWIMFRGAMPSLTMVRVCRCLKLKSCPLDVTKRDAIWRKEDDNTPGGALINT